MSTRSVGGAGFAPAAGAGVAVATAPANSRHASTGTRNGRIRAPPEGHDRHHPSSAAEMETDSVASSAVGHVVVVGVAGLVAVGLLALDFPADVVVALVDAVLRTGHVAVVAVVPAPRFPVALFIALVHACLLGLREPRMLDPAP